MLFGGAAVVRQLMVLVPVCCWHLQAQVRLRLDVLCL